MDEKAILTLLASMLNRLEAVETCVKEDKWGQLDTILEQVALMEKQIKNNPVSIDTFMKKNASFKKKHAAIQAKLRTQIDRNTEVITKWKEETAAKLSDSRNLSGNISKYHKEAKRSYYIDKNE